MPTAAKFADFQQPGCGAAGSVPAPELGPDVCVYLRRLSFADLTELDRLDADEGMKNDDRIVRRMILCVGDEEGKPVFDDSAASRSAILGLPLTLLKRITKGAISENTKDDAAKK